MQRALISLAVVSVLAGIASAAPVTILDEGYTAFDGYGPPSGGTWAGVSKDTTVAWSGSASMKIDNHLPQEPYIQCRVALDSPVAVSSITPTSASLSFAYKLNMDAGGPETKSLNFGLQWGDWGYQPGNGGYSLSGAATLTADNAWHTATIPFSGWTTAPAAGAQIDWMTVSGDWSTDTYTLNLDQFVLTSPVPEPTSLSLLGLGVGLLARRRRAA